jgi:cell division protein FtsA
MKGETIVGLDIGTTKTCAVVAASGPSGCEILGIGEAASNGVRRGMVNDPEAIAKAISAAASSAQVSTGRRFSRVFVGFTGDHVVCETVRGTIDVQTGRQLIHDLPGKTFDEHHVVTGSRTALAEVVRVVQQAGLEPAGLVFEPFASSAATLKRAEMRDGVLMLDIGGGTTDVALYSGNSVIHSATVAAGGSLITSDIAYGLQTTLPEAERVKCAYASATRTAMSALSFAIAGDDGERRRIVTGDELLAIVEPRVNEIFSLVGQLLGRFVADGSIREVVLTGGAARLRGLDEAARLFFKSPVRIGLPTGPAGLRGSLAAPQYATAVGLVLYGSQRRDFSGGTMRQQNLRGRLSSWFSRLRK